MLGVARSARYRPQPAPRIEQPTGDDIALLVRIKELIEQHPTFGYRRIWARVRFGDQVLINKKRVRRILRQHGWMVHARQATPRPRVQRAQSVATHQNERWALDATHIACRADGWAHLVAVIDGHDRAIVGSQFTRRGRAKEAERALEAACLARYGLKRPIDAAMPVIRSDNGLIFQSHQFRSACNFYRLTQEYITPYTRSRMG